MSRLIKFEFRKLFKSKLFYVINLIAITMIILSCLTNKAILNSNIEGVNINNLSIINQTFSSGMITTLVPIFIALFVSEDETCGTLKNVYSKGYSVGKVYVSKYIVSLLVVLEIALVSFGLTFILGNNMFDRVALPTHLLLNIITQVVILTCLASFYVPISLFVGKAGSAIALVIVGPMAINIVLSMITSFLKLKTSLNDYWVDAFLNKIANVYDSKVLINYIIYALIYILIFTVIGNILVKRKIK